MIDWVLKSETQEIYESKPIEKNLQYIEMWRLESFNVEQRA